MRRTLCAVLLSTLAVGLGPALADGATLEVSITHPDDPAATRGREVKLLGVTGDNDTLTRAAQTDAAGQARFEDLSAPGTYLVLVEYAGVSFHGEAARFGPADAADAIQRITISLHEPSDDPGQIELRAIRIFLQHEAAAYRWDQVVELTNTGTRVILLDPEVPPPLSIALVPGRGELRTPTGLPPSGFTPREDVLALVGPVHPGAREVVFSYDLPSETGELDLELFFPDETPSVELYIADKRIAIDAGRLHPARVARDANGTAYQRYLGFDIPAGTRIPLRIRPLAPLGSGSPWGAALAAAALGAVLIVFVGRPVTVAARTEHKGEEVDAEHSERQALYAALADLEHDFETGKLTPEDRDRLRAELRNDALLALARLRHSEPAPDEKRGCPDCSRPVGAADKFCAECGARL
jgi:hypothetical protein